jgi:hypothetical protein
MVMFWLIGRAAVADSMDGDGKGRQIPDTKYPVAAAYIVGVMGFGGGGSGNSGQFIRNQLAAGWIGLKGEYDRYSDIYKPGEKIGGADSQVLFCGSALGCENYEQAGSEVQCLAKYTAPKSINAGLIKDADKTDIDLKKLSRQAKVQVCNALASKLNKFGIPIREKTESSSCKLQGYNFPGPCGEIFISTEGVECYMFSEKVGPTLPSRFSEDQIAKALMTQFGAPTVKLSELIRPRSGSPDCGLFVRRILVNDLEPLRASIIESTVTKSAPIVPTNLSAALKD